MYQIDTPKEAIREIQKYLEELSYTYREIPRISIDGIFGEETRKAVNAFQRYFGLTQTGEVDFPTFLLLYEEYIAAKEERLGESELIPAKAFPMKIGDSGSYIRILQGALAEITGTRLPSDGFFGRTTEDAVRMAERRYGMNTGGVVDRALWARIAASYHSAVEEKIPF